MVAVFTVGKKVANVNAQGILAFEYPTSVLSCSVDPFSQSNLTEAYTHAYKKSNTVFKKMENVNETNMDAVSAIYLADYKHHIVVNHSQFSHFWGIFSLQAYATTAAFAVVFVTDSEHNVHVLSVMSSSKGDSFAVLNAETSVVTVTDNVKVTLESICPEMTTFRAYIIAQQKSEEKKADTITVDAKKVDKLKKLYQGLPEDSIKEEALQALVVPKEESELKKVVQEEKSAKAASGKKAKTIKKKREKSPSPTPDKKETESVPAVVASTHVVAKKPKQEIIAETKAVEENKDEEDQAKADESKDGGEEGEGEKKKRKYTRRKRIGVDESAAATAPQVVAETSSTQIVEEIKN